MFDLRYHVASLAAVFLALIIGIVVGVGISGKGFVSDSERSLFNERIADLNSRLESATKRGNDLARAQRAAQSFVEVAYPALMRNRLAGMSVTLVFAGPVNGTVRSLVEQALADGGAVSSPAVRALELPIDPQALRRALRGRPALAALAAPQRIADLGRRLGAEMALGGSSPLWKLLTGDLVEERSGAASLPPAAVVVSRSVLPQSGVTARFLSGFYEGLASLDVPAVGVEVSTTTNTAADAFAKHGLSTVDDVDTQMGKLALALLAAGASPGQYGIKQDARNGVLPPVPVG